MCMYKGYALYRALVQSGSFIHVYHWIYMYEVYAYCGLILCSLMLQCTCIMYSMQFWSREGGPPDQAKLYTTTAAMHTITTIYSEALNLLNNYNVAFLKCVYDSTVHPCIICWALWVFTLRLLGSCACVHFCLYPTISLILHVIYSTQCL